MTQIWVFHHVLDSYNSLTWNAQLLILYFVHYMCFSSSYDAFYSVSDPRRIYIQSKLPDPISTKRWCFQFIYHSNERNNSASGSKKD